METSEKILCRAGALAVSVRAADDGHDDGRLATLDIQFARFNSWNRISSWWEGDFYERVNPGAFSKTMSERAGQVKVLFNHGRENDGTILGVVDGMGENRAGPYGTVGLFDIDVNRRLLPGLRAGVYGASYMFEVLKEQIVDNPERSAHNPDGLPERTIQEVRLYEFGPVTFPADEGASVGVRSMTHLYLPEHLRTRPGAGGLSRAAETPSDEPQEHSEPVAPFLGRAAVWSAEYDLQETLR